MKILALIILSLANLAYAGTTSGSFNVNIILVNPNYITPIPPPITPNPPPFVPIPIAPYYSLYGNYIFSCSSQFARFDGTATTFCTPYGAFRQPIEIPNGESDIKENIITKGDNPPYIEKTISW